MHHDERTTMRQQGAALLLHWSFFLGKILVVAVVDDDCSMD
jgi:hypothetical protein